MGKAGTESILPFEYLNANFRRVQLSLTRDCLDSFYELAKHGGGG